MNTIRAAGIGRALLIVLAVLLTFPRLAVAQDPSASPVASPAGPGVVIHSQTREEFYAEAQADFAATDEPVEYRDGTFVVAATDDMQSFNPFLVESTPSALVVGMIYDTLYGYDPRTGEPAPGGLTDSWDISADGLSYTFHLNPNAHWQDGVDVTSDDVAFSLAALADPATKSVFTGTFNNAVASWRVVDPHTIEIVAKEVRFTFLYDLQNFWIVPEHIWTSVPHVDWATDPGSTGQDPSRIIGSGPFTFGSWKQGEEIRLTRNDAYYDIKPNIKDYVIRIFPSDDAAFNAFLDGEVDQTTVAPEQLNSIRDDPDIQWDQTATSAFYYYEFNLDPAVTTLFQDRRVRQAFMYALDRQSIVDNIYGGLAEVPAGAQPSISPAYAPDRVTTPYRYDPDKARALLADAGWVDTNGDGVVDKDGQAMSFELLYPDGSATFNTLVAYMQDAWKAVGIDVNPVRLEFSELIEVTTTNPTFAMAIYGFGWDATFVQNMMFGCDQYQVGYNDMRYCNPELDAVNAEAIRTFDPVKRTELLIQASNIVNDDQPIGILSFIVSVRAWHTRVHNEHPSIWGNQSYVGIWVDD